MITVLGRIFPALFSSPDPRPGSPSGKCIQARNDPRQPSGVISFPWVQSLGNLAFCWISRAFDFGWNPFRSIHVPQLTYAIGIYVKRKIMKAQPAGVITISGITFFRTISLPYPKAVYKMGKSTNNFRFFGIKRRFRNFSPLLVDTSDRMCYDDSVGASLRRCPLSVSLRLLSNLVGGIRDTRPTGIKKELLPQRDPTHDLNFSHVPITVCPRGLPAKRRTTTGSPTPRSI